jgi:RNA polymerase sigma factor (sigma-70 family)
VNEVFLKLHQTTDRFQHGRRVKPWIDTIADRTIIDYARHESRDTYYRTDNLSLSIDTPREAVVCETPCTLAERKELAVNVRAIFDRLPDNERAVMERLYFHNETIEQAAVSLGCCRAQVNKLASRARSRVAMCLSHSYKESNENSNGHRPPGCIWRDSMPPCELAVS